MVRIKFGEAGMRGDIRARVRFDYKGVRRTNYFFFGSKPTEEIATEIRQQQASLLKNVPQQNVCIAEINTNFPVYMMYDEHRGEMLAYAPMEVIVSSTTIEDIMHFILRDEFRTVEILEPELIHVSRTDVERFFFRMSETIRNLTGDAQKKRVGND